MENLTIKEKREALKEISNVVKPLVKEGKYHTVNEAILEIFYSKDGHEVFKTYDQWKESGKQVKRGEKAFVVWGSPKKKKENEPQENEEDKESFYPLCFLFSNLQVN